MPSSCRCIPSLSQAIEGVRLKVMKARATNILMLFMAVGGLEDQLLLDCLITGSYIPLFQEAN